MDINEFRQQFPEYGDMTDSDLTTALHAKHGGDMPYHEFAKQFIGKPNHDDLMTAAVTAADSLKIQNSDPTVKPVVVGTPEEVLALKQAGKVGKGKEIFQHKGKAYIIDHKGAESVYGASKAGSVKMAKMDLLKGNDSRLLGYPERTGNDETMAVSKGGEILTDLARISDEAKTGNLAYAAEGQPEDLAPIGEKVAQAVKAEG